MFTLRCYSTGVFFHLSKFYLDEKPPFLKQCFSTCNCMYTLNNNGLMPKYLLYWPGRQGVLEKYFTAKGVRSPKSLGTAALSQWCISHILPYFHKIYTFLPYFRKIIHFPPYFPKIYVFCLIYVFVSPYFDNDALHVHVLDAPVVRYGKYCDWASLRALVKDRDSAWWTVVHYRFILDLWCSVLDNIVMGALQEFFRGRGKYWEGNLKLMARGTKKGAENKNRTTKGVNIFTCLKF